MREFGETIPRPFHHSLRGECNSQWKAKVQNKEKKISRVIKTLKSNQTETLKIKAIKAKADAIINRQDHSEEWNTVMEIKIKIIFILLCFYIYVYLFIDHLFIYCFIVLCFLRQDLLVVLAVLMLCRPG